MNYLRQYLASTCGERTKPRNSLSVTTRLPALRPCHAETAFLAKCVPQAVAAPRLCQRQSADVSSTAVLHTETVRCIHSHRPVLLGGVPKQLVNKAQPRGVTFDTVLTSLADMFGKMAVHRLALLDPFLTGEAVAITNGVQLH